MVGRCQAELAVKHEILNQDQSFRVAKVSRLGAQRMLTPPVTTSRLVKLSMSGQTSGRRLHNQKEGGTRALFSPSLTAGCLARTAMEAPLCPTLCVCSGVSDPLGPHGLQPARRPCPWGFPGKKTGVGCHYPLQGILPDPRIELASPALTGGFCNTEAPGKQKLPGWHLGHSIEKTQVSEHVLSAKQ